MPKQPVTPERLADLRRRMAADAELIAHFVGPEEAVKTLIGAALGLIVGTKSDIDAADYLRRLASEIEAEPQKTLAH